MSEVKKTRATVNLRFELKSSFFAMGAFLAGWSGLRYVWAQPGYKASPLPYRAGVAAAAVASGLIFAELGEKFVYDPIIRGQLQDNDE
jgi:hypothetical protein